MHTFKNRQVESKSQKKSARGKRIKMNFEMGIDTIRIELALIVLATTAAMIGLSLWQNLKLDNE